MEENKKKIIKSIVTISILLFVGSVILINFTAAPYVVDIEISDSKRFEDKVVFNVSVGNSFLKFDKDTWCYITKDALIPDINAEEWVKADNGYCSFTTDSGLHNIYVKDSFGNISDIQSQKVQINKVLRVDLNKEAIYMYKGRKEKLSYSITKLGNPSEDVTWKVQDTNIATVDNEGNVTAVNYGITYVEAISSTGAIGKTKVFVSSYITKPTINFNKNYLGCKQFSNEEAQMLDNTLLNRIEEAGYGTRAGVVAAARFLTLEFNFRVHYFFENGRLENYGPYMKVDGEGRYYHKGLFLSVDKYNELSTMFEGPAMWGCSLKNYTTQSGWVSGKSYPNGLDCSGFVTWALLNGGFDVGDIGAGASSKTYDLDDIGKKVNITDKLMNSGQVKVGDLIGNNGHMAIIAGWDDKNYYIAESLDTTKGVVMTTVSKNKLVGKSIYKYIILMDDVYKEEGNLTTMW
jgi:hypothetical protein